MTTIKNNLAYYILVLDLYKIKIKIKIKILF